jgi:putative redox protein
VFTRRIQYIGKLSEAERARLTEIAEKCPVHRTLLGQIRITTHIVD